MYLFRGTDCCEKKYHLYSRLEVLLECQPQRNNNNIKTEEYAFFVGIIHVYDFIVLFCVACVAMCLDKIKT